MAGTDGHECARPDEQWMTVFTAENGRSTQSGCTAKLRRKRSFTAWSHAGLQLS